MSQPIDFYQYQLYKHRADKALVELANMQMQAVDYARKNPNKKGTIQMLQSRLDALTDHFNQSEAVIKRALQIVIEEENTLPFSNEPITSERAQFLRQRYINPESVRFAHLTAEEQRDYEANAAQERHRYIAAMQKEEAKSEKKPRKIPDFSGLTDREQAYWKQVFQA